MCTTRVQCLSNLAQLQQSGNIGQLAVSSQRSTRAATNKRDSQQQPQPQDSTTEKLLHEKDEEIRRMQAMIKQMQSQLSQAHSGPNSMDDSTTV